MEISGMTTRSKSKITGKPSATSAVNDDILEEAAVDVPNTEDRHMEVMVKEQVKGSLSSQSCSSKVSKLQAQVRADEELSKLLSQEEEIMYIQIQREKAILIKEEEMLQKRLQHEKQAIENKLKLERAQSTATNKSNSDLQYSQLSSKEKVRQWLPHTLKSAGSCHSLKLQEHRSVSEKNDNNLTPVTNLEIKQLLARQCINKELQTFSGDLQEWPNFYTEFMMTTRISGFDDEENLCRLRRCLKGDAKKAVQAMLFSGSSLNKILEVLESRFGRPDLIVRSLINDARNSPVVKIHDFKGLINFADTVSNLVVTMESMNMSQYLNNPQLLDEMLQKLPYGLQQAWGEIAAKRFGRVSLKDFKQWIWTKSEGANYAMALASKPSCFGNREEVKDRPTSHKLKSRYTVLTTSQKGKHHSKHDVKCVCCQGDRHPLDRCDKFKNMDVEDKWKIVTQNNVCFGCLIFGHRLCTCYKKKKCDMNNCDKFHHPLLHKEFQEVEQTPTKTVAYTTQSISEAHVLLRVASVTIKTSNVNLQIYALFDEASTVTLIDESVADKLCLRGSENSLRLRWTDKTSFKDLVSRKISFDICGENGSVHTLQNVYTMKDMELPVQTVNAQALKAKWRHLRQIDFASMKNAKPQLLIGQDNWDLITSRQIIEGPRNAPALSYTKLGWVLHGNVHQFRGRVDDTIVLHIRHQKYEEADLALHQQVKTFFSDESFGVKIPDNKLQSKEDARAELIMEKFTKRVNNRWETGLIWKTDDMAMPESKPEAMKRLRYIQNRMNRDLQFAEAYRNKIKEYLEKGYARRVTQEELDNQQGKIWYLPHFAVVNENKPGKIRFVFDAASKIEGNSLNDFLIKGPDLYNSLVGIMWRFRQKLIAFSADIREMFHQVRIRTEDQVAQRFLWKENNSETPDVYAMNVMIFGAVCSPFSAQYVKNKNAREFEDQYPQAVNAILYNHYMDDYLDSVDTEEEAIRLVNQIIMIHQKGGFDLRSWVSNSTELLRHLPSDLQSTEKIMENDQNLLQPQRILGIKWKPAEDILTFPLSLHKVNKKILTEEKVPTKREMLKLIMSLFDPLGMLGHYLVKGKILLQEVWKSGIDWDEEIPTNMFKRWQKWLRQLQQVERLEIPRYYIFKFKEFGQKEFDLQLHIFCDASEQAFAAVGYFRFEQEGKIQITLVMSRTQVAPIRPMTIPRLELQAAVMATRLGATIKQEHTLQINRTYFWTDSTTVLSWIKSDVTNFKTFVAHRVSEIQEKSNSSEWNWISTKMNVADQATRDDKEANLNIKGQWYQGPEFLYLPEEQWPVEEKHQLKHQKNSQDCSEFRKHRLLLITNAKEDSHLPDLRRFSKWTRLIRATAYVLKFIELCKAKRRGENLIKELVSDDLRNAEIKWCQKSQRETFREELNMLLRKQDLPKSSRLLQLSPMIDDKELIRLRGRTEKSPELNVDTKKPIILDGKHLYTRLLINYYHCKTGHGGTGIVLNELRQKYWILQGRKIVNTVSKNCLLCKIRRAKPMVQEMGQIPEVRLTRPQRPFMFVGLDYFGPYDITIGRRREKRYGVVFTCLSIRAIHIELADSLTTDSAILALRRFISRRGQPKTIWSDNGTNLKGASKELNKSLTNIDKELIRQELLSKNIDWRFIPPASPHMGGTWERMVRSVKEALRITLKERAPRQEVLETLLVEAEHLVNSRPLTYVSSDPGDPDALTPNHFLIGTSSSVKPPGLFDKEIWNVRKQWQIAQNLTEKFWNRWVREYIPTLTKRTKWFQQTPNLKIGDTVIIMDNQLPRNNWPLGRVEATYPGSDNLTRVADIKTKFGIYRRPIVKLCKLDLLELSDDSS